MPTTWTTTTDLIGDTGAFDSRMIFGDFDGDGDIDILFQNGNTAGAGIGYKENNGDGTFVTYADATAAGSLFQGVDFSGRQISPANFIIRDFDGNGTLDILDRTSNSTTFFLNLGGTNGFTRIPDPVPDTGSFDQRMVWGDWDGDGDVDALYQNGNSAGVNIGFLRNDGGLTFTNFTNAAAAGSPFAGLTFTGLQITTSTFVVDVDDDGDMDILDRGTTQVLYRNDGGTFTRLSDPLGDTGAFDARMVFGDFDSDGDTDAIYQNGNIAGAGFGYFRNDGGTFTNFTSLSGTPFASADFTGQQLTTWTAVDIDGDGDVDIVDRDQAGGGLVLYLQNGSPPSLIATTPSNNGHDVAVGANLTLTFSESVSQGTGNIYIYRGDGTLIETIDVQSSQVSGSGTTWTINPSVTLANSTGYYIHVDQETFFDDEGAVFAGISDNGVLNFATEASNTAPSFTNLNGDSAAYTEGAAVRLDVGGNATVADAEQANFAGGTLTVAITAGGVGTQDVLGVANIGTGAGQISVSGATINFQGVSIGTVTGGTAGANLVITLDSDATPAATQALVRALTYNNLSDAPNAATRTVTVALTDGNGGTSATQTTTVSVTAVNDAHTGGVSVSGTAAEDQVLTAVSTLADADGIGTLHYQWQQDSGSGFVNVGADQSTYTLGDGDVGGVVRVVTYYTDAGGTMESATSSATTVIEVVNDAPTGGATVAGTATEDEVLTADTSTLADADGVGSLHYDWQRDTGSGFVSIGAADQSTYALGDADVGFTVRVVVTYIDGQGFTNAVTSDPTNQIAGINDLHTGGASVSGTQAEDNVLTAVSTLTDADGLGALHFQWQRDSGVGFINVGADQSTYTLGDDDIGGVVRVVIYYTDAGGTVESATSSATGTIGATNDAATGGVSINGTATEDEVLTADTSTLSDSDGLGTLHYDWQRDTGSGFVSIAAADQATYSLGDGDTGAIIRVVVSYDDGQGFSNVVTSGATGIIVNVDDAGTANDDAAATTESSAQTGNVFLDNGSGADVDVDSTLTVAKVNGSAASVGTVITLASGAHLTLLANGDFTYDPHGAFDVLPGPASGAANTTATDSFTYSLADGSTATVTITISGQDSSDDVLAGTSGDDTLDGGVGASTMTGGDGDDTYIVDNAGDQVVESSGGGSDTVRSSVTYTLGASVENLVLTGSADIDGTGNALNNALTGNAGNNVLNGGAGADTLSGGAGNDTYSVDNASDVVIEGLRGGGVDLVLSSVTFNGNVAGNVGLENITLVGTRAVNARGNDLANTIIGNDANNYLTGDGGADTLIGGLGNDTYGVDNRSDVIVEAANAGTDYVRSTVSWTLGANLENLNLYGHADIFAIGNDLKNVIVGNDGDNIIAGKGGADMLTGGAGADTFDYNAITESSYAAYDRITDLTNSDKIDLSGIDANAGLAGNQAFAKVNAFTHHAGEITLTYDAAKDFTVLAADVNGDGVADMRIVINGDHHTFTNFIF